MQKIHVETYKHQNIGGETINVKEAPEGHKWVEPFILCVKGINIARFPPVKCRSITQSGLPCYIPDFRAEEDRAFRAVLVVWIIRRT